MNYQLHYNLLINRAKSENRRHKNRNHVDFVYYEKHHIIPKCLGGNNNKENLVLLKPEEHFLAHLLLVKIYPEHPGLTCAVVKLTRKTKNGQRMNNKLYSWVRKKHAENVAILHKDKKCGMHGKVHTEETKRKISLSNQGKDMPKGKNSASFGLKRSQETKDKISKARTGVSTGKRTEETKQKMRDKRKLQTKTRDMEISVNGIVFSSATKAAEFLGITTSSLCKRMRTGKYPDYFYLHT